MWQSPATPSTSAAGLAAVALAEESPLGAAAPMEESFDVTECASLITNSFTLNSGPRPLATSRLNALQQQRQQQRHPISFFNGTSSAGPTETTTTTADATITTELAVISGRVSSDDEDALQSLPQSRPVFHEELSFYDQELVGHGGLGGVGGGSPIRTCSSRSPFRVAATGDIDNDDDDDDDIEVLRSADSSPVTFQVINHLDDNNSSTGKRRGSLLNAAKQNKQQLSFDAESADANSVDSGYDGTNSSSFNKFRFAQPTRVAPKRLDSGIGSPRSSASVAAPSKKQLLSSFSLFNSGGSSSQESVESMDEDYLALLEMESEQDAVAGPSNISSLICGAIKAAKTTSRTPETKIKGRRCLNLDLDSPVLMSPSNNPVNSSPNASPIVAVQDDKLVGILTPKRGGLNHEQQQQPPLKCFKRPEPLLFSPVQSKRYKSEIFALSSSKSASQTAHPRLEQFDFDNKENQNEKTCSASIGASSTTTATIKHNALGTLQRAVSLNEAMIMSALNRSSMEPDLIGDLSKPFCLPLMAGGRHKDLKSITAATMAGLMRGTFEATVATFKIVDCRYPYEFEGGHIRGAKNLYTPDQILAELNCEMTEAKKEEGAIEQNEEEEQLQKQTVKRHILVFHCEFSSERGPKLSRFLRSHDRQTNDYPALQYPEIYLLNGGYKEFFESYPDLCDPIAYRTMLDPDFGDAYRHFRAKTKSWGNGGDGGRSTAFNRTKSRSRLLL